jgi:hypothetical protein
MTKEAPNSGAFWSVVLSFLVMVVVVTVTETCRN